MAKDNVGKQLVEIGSESELFHTPEDEAYATVKFAGGVENYPVESENFKGFLSGVYYLRQYLAHLNKSSFPARWLAVIGLDELPTEDPERARH